MASIVKRKKKFSVVYTYTDDAGKKHQKWETFDTNAEAKKRKAQVEYEQDAGTFIVPSAKTVRDLLTVRTVCVNNVKPRNEFLTAHTVREIHKLLRNAFNQAVKWELMARNPVEHATLPKEEHQHRDIWTADILFKAI